jgi:CRP-like cAMP-binding protein/CheY-like chemotaxis protein
MKKIIIIEDDEFIRDSTEEILQLADYQVFTAKNGKTGVELVKREKPDLVICDIMMPDLDGYGVLNILSKNTDTTNIPFIFLTAKSELTDMRKGMNHGADDYIIKPFEENLLLEAIEVRLKKNESIKKSFSQDIDGLNEFMNEVRGLDGLKNLSEERKRKLFKKKETIYSEDDYANYMYYIIKGKIKCIKTDFFGKEFVNDVFSSGDFIGYITLFDKGEYHESAIAMENTEVAVIPREEFLTLIRKNRDVAAKFITMLSGNVQAKEKRLLQIAFSPIRERLAETLLSLKEKGYMKPNSTTEMEISRFDLASIVGTAKESLIRSLTELKKEGLVDTNGQDIIILNEKGLKKIAGGGF